MNLKSLPLNSDPVDVADVETERPGDEDALNAEEKLYRTQPKVIVGPAVGPGKLTKKAAQASDLAVAE